MSLVIKSISINQIRSNPNRLRESLESDKTSLSDLARNIMEHGLLQPIIVREIETESYIIVKGERRYQACIYNGVERIGCIIISSNEPEVIGLSATLARKDLKEIEKAKALYDIRTQYEYSNVDLAKKLGISEGYVRKLLKIHDLPHDLKKDINDGKTTAHEAVNGNKKSTNKYDKEIMLQLKQHKALLVNAIKQLELTEIQQKALFQAISEESLQEEIRRAMNS